MAEASRPFFVRVLLPAGERTDTLADSGKDGKEREDASDGPSARDKYIPCRRVQCP